MSSEGYEYDNETEGMRDALERARSSDAPDLDAHLERLRASWDAPAETIKEAEAIEEVPTKATGDAPPPAAQSSEEPNGLPPPPKEPPTEPWALIAHGLNENATRKPPEDHLVEKMKAVGWSPKESAPPDWEGLQKDLQAAEHGAETQRTIGAMLHAAAPGFEAPSNAGAEDVAAARAPLEIAQQKAAAEERQRQHQEQLLEAAKKAELDDPASGMSKRAQEAYRTQFGGDSRLLPAGLEQMSANEVAGLTHTATSLSGQKNTADIAKSKGDAAAKEKEAAAAAKGSAAEKSAAEESASLEQERNLLRHDPGFAKLGMQPDDVSALDRKGISNAFHQIELLHDKGKSKQPQAHILAGDIGSVPERRAGYRSLVKAIADGREGAPNAGARSGQELLSDVLAFKPDFDATKFGNYSAVTKHQATGQDVLAIDVARQHMKTARDAIPENADLQWVNKAKQALASGSGSAEFKPFAVASTAVAHELARVYGVGDQAGKEEMLHMLSPAQSPEQLRAALDTFDELVSGKQEGLKRQLEKVAPSGQPQPAKDHGAVKRETKSFIEYQDGHVEKKAP